LYFFLKTPCSQNFALLVGGDVFFLLCRVEEGEEEDGYDYCAPDVQEFICREHKFSRWAHQERSAFVIRLDYQGG